MMKKVLIYSVLAIMLSFSAFSPSNENISIVGKWECIKKFNGSAVSLVAIFRANGVYDGFVDKKAFVTGKYKMTQDTLHFIDVIGNGIYDATYKVKFFGDRDSLKVSVIQDTVVGRRQGTDGFVFKRIKND